MYIVIITLFRISEMVASHGGNDVIAQLVLHFMWKTDFLQRMMQELRLFSTESSFSDFQESFAGNEH